MTAELALSGVQTTGRDYGVVLEDMEWRVKVELARILAPMVDPLLQVLLSRFFN